MKYKLLCAAAAVAICAAGQTVARMPAPETRRLETLTARFQKMVDDHLIPGAVLLVMHQGNVVWNRAVGVQDLETKRPMRTDTIFQIMSMTKPLTAAALMMLVEQGKVLLTDPVSRYLPEFANPVVAENGKLRRPTRGIEVRDLLNHTSGMTDPPANRRQQIYASMELPLADAVKVYAELPLTFDPGTHWAYSNVGVATAGRIIEVASGVPYEKFMQANLLEPLGMKDTFYFPAPAAEPRIALVYNYSQTGLMLAGDNILGGQPQRFRHGAKYPAPEWGLFSTAADTAAFHQMMLDGGVYRGKRILSKSAVTLMTTVSTGNLETNAAGYGTGLGWRVVRNAEGMDDLLPVGTYDHQGAFGTYGFVDPRKRLVGILMMAVPGRANQLPEHVFATMVEAAFQE